MDYAASTPVRAAALARYQEVACSEFANPSGSHSSARRSKEILEDAREGFARLLGSESQEVIFTSGGTEADNLALLGLPDPPGSTSLALPVEHHGVLEPLRRRNGTIFLRMTSDGAVDLDYLEDTLRSFGSKVSLVSLMAVNNETGVITAIGEASALVRRYAPDAFVFSDAVQGGPWLDLSKFLDQVDVLSLSAHKFGGPKGVGVLVAKRKTNLRAQILGGGQELELRSGTQNVPAIAASYVAYRESVNHRNSEEARIKNLHPELLRPLVEAGMEFEVTGCKEPRVPGIVHLTFGDLSNEELLYLCDENGLEISGGASCASGALEPSHVLRAMGMEENRIRSALRISMGYLTTAREASAAGEVLLQAVARLR